MVRVALGELVERFGGELIGDSQHLIGQVATLERARGDEASFLANPKYLRQLAASAAGVVILSAAAREGYGGNRIVTCNPYGYFARVAQLLNPPEAFAPGIHASATVESVVPASVAIGPGCHVAAGALIGEGCRIGAGSVIGAEAQIGDGSILHANVSIYAGSRIGRRALIHSGAVVGSDGFGFARETDGAWLKIPQIGRVLIGDDVEIGAGTTIDRGALDDTVIDDGVKLDNQIQIGHNVRVGAHTAMAGCVGIAGSARIGRRCTLGGGAVILGHLTLCDEVHVSAGTLVSKSINKPGSYSGTVPFQGREQWLKNFAHLRHLDGLADRIRALESRLAELENKA